MKPHKLTIENFGPFLGKTIIDFDTIGNTVYLITGETGAGKTMIFDAITFALYGEASGEKRKDLGIIDLYNNKLLKEHKKPKMRVALTFSLRNDEYKVVREVSWGKTGIKSTIEWSEISMEKNGQLIIEYRQAGRIADFNEQIATEIGLSLEQFRKIILLAQGEFDKLLESDSKAAAEIIGKLYGNEKEKSIEARIIELNKSINNKNSDNKTKLTAVLTGISGLLDEPVNALDDNLTDILTAKINELTVELTNINETLKKQEAAVLAANNALETNRSNNQLWTQYSDAKKKLDNLESSSRKYQDWQTQADNAEKAEQVMSYEEAMKDEQQRLSQIKNDISTLKAEIEKIDVQYNDAKEKVESTEKTENPKIEELTQKKNLIAEKKSVYESKTKALTELGSAKREFETTKNCASKASKELSDAKDQLEKIERELSTLQDAGAGEVSAKEAAVSKLNSQKQALDELAEKVSQVRDQKRRAESAKGAYLQKQKDTVEKLKKYSQIHELFVNGYASLLACELEKDIKEKGTGICPVCHKKHTTIGEFASLKEKIVTKDDDDAARSSYDFALKVETDAKIKVDTSEATLEEKLSQANSAGQAYFGNEWTLPENDNQINDEKRKLTDRITTAKAELKNAEKSAEKKTKLLENKSHIDINHLTQISEEATALQSVAQNALSIAETKVSGINEQLDDFPETWALAQDEIDKAERAIKASENKIKVAKENEKSLSDNLSNSKGALTTKQQDKDTSERNLSDKTAEFERERNARFTKEQDYIDACSPEGNALNRITLHRWISAKRNNISTYNEEKAKAVGSESTLKNSISEKGITGYVALKNYEDTVARATQEKKDTEEKRKAEDRKLSNLSNALAQVEEYVEERNKLNKMSAIVSSMAHGSDATKYSTYVLYDFFQHVVEQANYHLDILTDGEFSLEQSFDGRSNNEHGLSLQVKNNFEDGKFKIPQFSGGQRFEASLALALGLSQVAQMESATNISVDSMFIDEGFGSLSENKIKSAIEVLNKMSDGHAQIGIISHMPQLEECLEKKIRVTRTNGCSKIEYEEC